MSQVVAGKTALVLANDRLGERRFYEQAIDRGGDGFVALCPELDIASQGETIETARDNLREALELFFECASPQEVQDRLGEDVFVTQVEVSGG